jgi:hypothetical protein
MAAFSPRVQKQIPTGGRSSVYSFQILGVCQLAMQSHVIRLGNGRDVRAVFAFRPGRSFDQRA